MRLFITASTHQYQCLSLGKKKMSPSVNNICYNYNMCGNVP